MNHADPKQSRRGGHRHVSPPPLAILPTMLTNFEPGVYAWLADGSETTHSTNVGVVIANDGVTVIDSGPTPRAAGQAAAAIAELTPTPIRRLVLSGSHIDLVGGTAAFPLAAIYGSGQTSDHLDQEPNPAAWKHLHPELASQFDEFVTRPVSHVVGEPAYLCPASIAVPVAGPQFENLCVQVPAANVVFAGCVTAFGSVPLGFEADFEAWISTLETLSTLGEIFVPAHGAVGGTGDLMLLVDYLTACLNARGSVAKLVAGPWTEWHNQHFNEINVERCHMLTQGDPSPPPSMLRLLGHT